MHSRHLCRIKRYLSKAIGISANRSRGYECITPVTFTACRRFDRQAGPLPGWIRASWRSRKRSNCFGLIANAANPLLRHASTSGPRGLLSQLRLCLSHLRPTPSRTSGSPQWPCRYIRSHGNKPPDQRRSIRIPVYDCTPINSDENRNGLHQHVWLRQPGRPS